MSLANISFIKKLSLVFGSKAYLVYTNNPVPSLLIPLPSVDKTLKSAIFKTFSDLTNDQILTFHNKKLAQKDLNNIERQNKAKLDISETHIPQQTAFESIQNIQIKPQSIFLTLNQADHSLSFMQYGDLQGNIHNAKTNQKQDQSKTEKPKNQEKKGSKGQQDKGKTKQKNKKPGEQKQQFIEQPKFEKQQISTWNNEAPMLSTPPADQPKQDEENIHIKKFKYIPLAYLTDNIASKPIQIIHIQTSKQYLLLQILKIFCIANILAVYGLINTGSRSQNHNKMNKNIK